MAEELGRSLAEDMAQRNMKGRTLTLKLKTPGFEVKRVEVEMAGGGPC